MEENKNDGNLLFLMGRCCEEGKNDANAVKWYRKAIEHNAPQQIEAYQRLATLLREPAQPTQRCRSSHRRDGPVRPQELPRLPGRGRYRRQFGLPESEADFQKALELAEGSPDVYLEMAKTAETESRYDAARQILEAGLKKTPASAELYEALANLELRTGHTDQAVETLERGLKSPAEQEQSPLDPG